MSDRSGAGAVFDLEYQKYAGERLGRVSSATAIARDGIRKVLGIRRKARRKLFPWLFIAIAVLPAVALVGFRVLFSGFDDLELPSHAEYFDITATMSFIFVAFSAPELLIPDRVQGVLAVYSSRPIHLLDYLAARVVALAVVVMSFQLIPQTVLYVGEAILSGDFLGFVTGHLDLLWKVPAAALGFFAVQAGVALAVSAYAGRTGVAIGVYLGLMLASFPAAEGLREVTRWAGLLAVEQHPRVLRDWIFGISSPGLIPVEAGFGALASLLVIIVLSAVAALLLLRRYRRLT